MVYFTSDLHLGHKNILRLCDRPFASIEEMDDVLMDNWNRKIHRDDTVYIIYVCGRCQAPTLYPQ